MYRVIIVEDDPMVGAINRQYVDMNPRFKTAGVFKNGKDGLSYVKRYPVDLVILDYYMPVMDGMEFIRQIEALEPRPEVIMVTAANETETVKKLLGAGVVDYLVKPFEYARFEQALDAFARRQELIAASGKSMGQKEIDSIMGGGKIDGQGAVKMQKGLQEHTLEMVRQYMKANPEQEFTSEEIAEQVHLSRVTIRRYVNYMLETHEIVSAIDYQTGGRPSIKYRYLSRDGVKKRP